MEIELAHACGTCRHFAALMPGAQVGYCVYVKPEILASYDFHRRVVETIPVAADTPWVDWWEEALYKRQLELKVLSDHYYGKGIDSNEILWTMYHEWYLVQERDMPIFTGYCLEYFYRAKSQREIKTGAVWHLLTCQNWQRAYVEVEKCEI